VQTFLPYPDFIESSKALDVKRLGKQRVKAMQLLDALRVRQDWEPLAPARIHNHPACLMWKGHEMVLYVYTMQMCTEWRHEGHNDTVFNKILRMQLPYGSASNPWWYGNEKFHRSHRISLLWKYYNYYNKLFTNKEEQSEAEFYLRTGKTFRTWWPTEHLKEREYSEKGN